MFTWGSPAYELAATTTNTKPKPGNKNLLIFSKLTTLDEIAIEFRQQNEYQFVQL